MIDDFDEIMIGRQKKIGETPALVPLRPPQISQEVF
jgi:hypothetical protein